MPEPTAPHPGATRPRPRPSANGTTPPVPSEAAKARTRVRRPGAPGRFRMAMTTMAGRTMRRAVAMLAILAVPAVILAAPLPASAASSGRLCENSGSYCLGSSSVQANAIVVEKPLSGARSLTAVLQSGTFQGHAEYKLRFNANTTLCVAGDVFENVIIANCTATGTNWAQAGTRWINRAETISFGGGYDVYLAGLNTGNDYFLKYLGQTGFFYQFSWK